MLIPALIFLLALVLGLWNLGGPAPWWDEGWTLSVARQVAERGVYGRLLGGQPAPPGLEASPVVTLPVAAAFELFGVGLWQGRLIGVVCAAAALALLWLLAAQLYDRAAAWGALAAALLLPAHPQLNLLIQGRQVLAEAPMLLLLLGGYGFLLLALRGRALWALPAALLWLLALNTKAQLLPFWAASVALALLVALWARQWRAAALIAIVGATAYVGRTYVAAAVWALAPPRVQGGAAVVGLEEVMAVVLRPFNRAYALQMLLFFGLPPLAGLVWAAWRELRQRPALDAEALVRWALIGLAGSWLGWFAALSVGVPRYLFPAAFVAAVFAGAMLRDLTGGFRLQTTLERLAAPLRRSAAREPARPRPSAAQVAGAWLATLLVAAALPLTLLSYARYYPQQDGSAQRVAAFLNQRTPPGALVETYESELHFLLERPYHYPPDQLHVELNRRSLLGQDVPVDYDPLAADPDYLVVGTFARGNRLYDAALAGGGFSLLLEDGEYRVFERARR